VSVDNRLRKRPGSHVVCAGLHLQAKLFEAGWIARRKRLRKLRNLSLIRAIGYSAVLFQRALFGGLVRLLRTWVIGVRFRSSIRMFRKSCYHHLSDSEPSAAS